MTGVFVHGPRRAPDFGPAVVILARRDCAEGRQRIYTELLPCSQKGLRVGTPADPLPHMNTEVRTAEAG